MSTLKLSEEIKQIKNRIDIIEHSVNGLNEKFDQVEEFAQFVGAQLVRKEDIGYSCEGTTQN